MMANLHLYITVWMESTMRLPNTAHTSRPWRIHERTRDFRLEDVWALPAPGGPDDFPRLVQGITGARATRPLPIALWDPSSTAGESEPRRILARDRRVTADWVCSSLQPSPGGAGDPHRFRTETMKTTTTLLDGVLPEFVVNVFSGWLRRDFLHRIARIAERSA